MFTLTIKKIQAVVAALVLSAGVALVAAPSTTYAQASEAGAAAPAVAAETAAPAATPAPSAPPAEKVAVENPYGIKALWTQSDAVAKFVLLIMVVMSLGSWYILAIKVYEAFKMSSQAKMARATFFKATSLQAGLKTLAPGSAFEYIASKGIAAGEHHEGELTENIDRATWVQMNVDRSVSDVQSEMGKGLSFLATVGSTSPFVGLFGTVWGIYHALTAIGIAGQASIDKVAGPVGESLIMTAIGLAVAVPAVLGYNYLVSKNKETISNIRAFAADLQGVLMGAKSIR
jgi:biopolymer transport protein ExbB